ncbi:hypothetical protein DSCA_53220 [Desulfosarcina alkanivorans]|uniref:Uncharacterized protein n=1 Tax=Desulfosarcina alkanivorans TaxID=571177 RepID=A0A5K7YNP2_9BACT|nr:hypothetical protein DSCA_53220 [Desulfosarcina alkanivorans]
MKKRITIIYLIGMHLLLTVVLLKSDFIERLQTKLGIRQSELSAECTGGRAALTIRKKIVFVKKKP